MSFNSKEMLSNLKYDFPSSIVVFLVAMPLCLGIALASGAPLFSGLIAGIVGGIVVGLLSGSSLGVSGPAAGLAVIVATAIEDLGGFEYFLVAGILAGAIQILMGFAKAGNIAYFFPSSVVHGMLSGIGILIFLKQIPHAVGYDEDPEGDFEFIQPDGQNTFSELINMVDYINTGVIIITATSLFILILWDTKMIKGNKILGAIPGPLLAVLSGIGLNVAFEGNPNLNVSKDHLVNLPSADSTTEFFSNFTFPDFSILNSSEVYITAVFIAVVASLETLLSVEATDKTDPMKRTTPTNRELKAQGVGNIISSFIGGLPLTQVIVRSSANQQSGGRSKMSAIIHGFMILFSIILIPTLLNLIPLGSLAAILFVVGFKLAKPALFKKMFDQGLEQFIPFVVTILGIILTDLLKGIGLGLVVGIIIILRNNFKIPFILTKEDLEGGEHFRITLSEDVTFLNKASIQKSLAKIPNDCSVIIDASKTYFIHFDVIEIIEDFKISAENRNIELEVIDLYTHKEKEATQSFEVTKE